MIGWQNNHIKTMDLYCLSTKKKIFLIFLDKHHIERQLLRRIFLFCCGRGGFKFFGWIFIYFLRWSLFHFSKCYSYLFLLFLFYLFFFAFFSFYYLLLKSSKIVWDHETELLLVRLTILHSASPSVGLKPFWGYYSRRWTSIRKIALSEEDNVTCVKPFFLHK